MADDLKERGGEDRRRINVNQDYEVRDWAEKFGVSQDELRRAVAEVGDRVADVEDRLRSSRH